MNIQKLFALIICLLLTSQVFAQELTDQLTDYFKHHRESIYLHLNKNSYVNGENVWFQGYVMDRKTNFLSGLARNAYIQVFNEEGEEVLQQLYLVRTGTFEGTFELNEDFAPGNYFLVSQTKWMQNFKEDDVHIQAFEILGKPKQKLLATNDQFDIQFLPESGYLVDGLKSNLGIKAINQNGRGVPFEVEVYKNNELVTKSNSNFIGMAKIAITPEVGQEYSFKFLLPNNQVLEQQGLQIEEKGVNLLVNTLPPNQAIIALQSNFKTQEKLQPEDHRLIVHQEGKFFEIPVNANAEEMNFTFSVSKSNLFYGVNTATYFYKGKPMAERMFFHYPPSISSSASVTAKLAPLRNKDSVYVQLDFDGMQDQYAKMSISVLPEETVALYPNQSLASNLYLVPHIKGYIEKASYYFTEINRKKEADLDLLLLTQGWSRYQWDDVFGEPPSIETALKQGLDAKISIKNSLNKDQNQLLIQQTSFHEGAVYPINDDKSVYLENKFLIKGEKITMSLVGKKKRLQSLKRFDFDVEASPVNTLLPNDAKVFSLQNYTSYEEKKGNVENLDVQGFDDAEVLSEVIVKASIAPKQDFYLSEQEEFQFGFDGNFLKISEEEAMVYPLLSDYLSAKGWRVIDNISGISIVNNRGGSPLLFINNSRTNDFSVLNGLRMDQLESVYFDRTGYGGGVEAQGGIIRIKWRRTPIFTDPSDVNRSSISTIVEYGFEPIQQYYMPAYGFFDSESFRKVGAIDFKTNMVTDTGSLNFTIFDTELEELTLYIEGITEKGEYIQLKFPASVNY